MAELLKNESNRPPRGPGWDFGDSQQSCTRVRQLRSIFPRADFLLWTLLAPWRIPLRKDLVVTFRRALPSINQIINCYGFAQMLEACRNVE